MKGGKVQNNLIPVKINKIDEIHFWGNQTLEHMVFLHLGLVDNNLKGQAGSLQTEWLGYLNGLFGGTGIDVNIITLSHKQTQAVLDNASKRYGKKFEQIINDAVKLINKTIKYVESVITILNKGNKWVGWIYLSFAKHILNETIYFGSKLTEQMDPLNEIKYIFHHHDTELGVAEKLLDPEPQNNDAKETIETYIKHTRPSWSGQDRAVLENFDKSEQVALLDLSLKYSKELIKFAKDTGIKLERGKIHSILSPVLARHVQREFERFAYVTEQFYEQIH